MIVGIDQTVFICDCRSTFLPGFPLHSVISMLKWTGGSRRKVSTSRNSTQSKQRQYFEQKRRLQQTPTTDNPSETNKWDQSSDARSLDILSFVNLATVDRKKKSVDIENNGSMQALFNPSKLSSPAALKKFLSVHSTKPCETYDHNGSCISQEENGDLLKLSPAMAVKKIISELSNKPNEFGSIPGASSCHELLAEEALNSKEEVADFRERAPSVRLEPKRSDMKQKGKSTMCSDVSLLDILDDGDSERNLVRKSCREAYVGFSVKGLGKVEVKTPPHSPVPYQRSCPDPPQRAAKCTQNKEFQSIPFGIKTVLDSILMDTNLINDVRQSENIRDHEPCIDNTVFDKETHFEDIYFPNLFDEFEESPNCGEDGAFDELIGDPMWGATYKGTANANLHRKRKDRSWDGNLFKPENFYETASNKNAFDPTLTGFEEYDDFPTLRTEPSPKRGSHLYSARAGPSCSPIAMENKYMPVDTNWNRDIPKSKRKSNTDGLFSQPIWPFKDEVADFLDTTSLRSEESCYSARVKEVNNYSFQSYPEKHKINLMDDFQINSNLHLNSPKFKNISSLSQDKRTCKTKSSTSGCKLEKASLLMDGMLLHSDLFPDGKMYKKSPEPSKSVAMEQTSGTNLDFHANGEERHNIFNNPESELPNEGQSSYMGEAELGMKERHSESKGLECETEKLSDEAENVGHTGGDKCSFEEPHLPFEACSNGTLNTPVHSQQLETCNPTQDDCDKSSPFLSQAENQDVKGKCNAQFQVMLQSYVFQLLCVQKVLLEASGKDERKEANETLQGKVSSIRILNAQEETERKN